MDAHTYCSSFYIDRNEQNYCHGTLLRQAGRNLRAYFRRDFHPSQIDDVALARTRLPEIGYAAP